MPDFEGPTQYRELAASGELPPPAVPFTDALGQVNVQAAVTEAGGGMTADDAEAVMAVVRGDADLDSVKKDTLVAFIEKGNLNVGEDAQLSVSGNKEELVERLRDAYHA
jgi:tellurite resistance protein